jgi:hypothetical protein
MEHVSVLHSPALVDCFQLIFNTKCYYASQGAGFSPAMPTLDAAVSIYASRKMISDGPIQGCRKYGCQ